MLRALIYMAMAVMLCRLLWREWRRTHPPRREIHDALVLLEMEANANNRD